MKVDEFVAEMKRDWRRSGRVHKECMRCQFWDNIEQALTIIVRQRAALKQIAVEECGCGVPCDCHSWAGLAAIAREALEKEV